MSLLQEMEKFGLADCAFNRKLSKANYEKAVKIYEKAGQYAVYDAVNKGELEADCWRDCIPCEDRTPHEAGTCLVCGTGARE
jgi:hypothetical protein